MLRKFFLAGTLYAIYTAPHHRNKPLTIGASSQSARLCAFAKHSLDNLRSSKPPTTAPLDAFFRTYEVKKGFKYDPSEIPSASFAALRRHCRWKKRKCHFREAYAWERYRLALQDELKVWFGREDEIANWHALCRAVGVVPLPKQCRKCEKALRGKHVNLVDLIHWARTSETRGQRVRTFRSVSELASYCVETKKYFPLENVKKAEHKSNGKVVIRHLLRHLPKK